MAADGRRWLAQQARDATYDVIAVDAYRPPYIPFHLTTIEFFRLASDRMSADGVVAINVGRTPSDFALVDALVATLRQVFPSVYVIDEPGPPNTLGNSLVVATRQATTIDEFRTQVTTLSAGLPGEFRTFAENAAQFAREPEAVADAPIFTDDRSQVEQVVHGILWDFLTH